MPMKRDFANEPIELTISTDTVCAIIAKAREFDMKVEPSDPDPGSNASDDGAREILEDFPDDATETELRQLIDDLNDDEIVELIALTWVGRGDFGPEEWKNAKGLARERHRAQSADYLIGIPNLGAFLEEGLDALGHACEPG